MYPVLQLYCNWGYSTMGKGQTKTCDIGQNCDLTVSSNIVPAVQSSFTLLTLIDTKSLLNVLLGANFQGQLQVEALSLRLAIISCNTRERMWSCVYSLSKNLLSLHSRLLFVKASETDGTHFLRNVYTSPLRSACPIFCHLPKASWSS